MQEYLVEFTDPPASLVVRLRKVPKRGSWFDLGDGIPAQAKDIRTIADSPVIFAALKSRRRTRRD